MRGIGASVTASFAAVALVTACSSVRGTERQGLPGPGETSSRPTPPSTAATTADGTAAGGTEAAWARRRPGGRARLAPDGSGTVTLTDLVPVGVCPEVVPLEGPTGR